MVLRRGHMPVCMSLESIMEKLAFVEGDLKDIPHNAMRYPTTTTAADIESWIAMPRLWKRNSQATRCIEITFSQEKALVALGYSLVLVPLFLAAVWYASMGVASIFTDSANVDAGMHAMMIRLMEQYGSGTGPQVIYTQFNLFHQPYHHGMHSRIDVRAIGRLN